MQEIVLGDVPERGVARRGADHWAVRHGDEAISWGELAARVTRRARALAAKGIGEGDRVVLALPNSNAFYELTFALWKLGATPTVVSPRMPAAELREVVALAEPRAVLASDPALQDALGALAAEFGADHPDATPLASRVSPCWKIMTSGGSTGLPKLIVDAMPSRMVAGHLSVGLPEDGVMLNPGPLSHNFPFVMTHRALLQGTSVVGMERFDAEQFLALVDRTKAQWTTLVPTTMGRIARLPEEVRARYDVSSLERVWHTAAPIAPDLKQFWIDWLGGEKIWEMYGGSEGIGVTQLSGTEWLAHRGSVGKPAGGEMKIIGEQGEELPPGEIGEIYMRRFGLDADTRAYRYIGGTSRRRDDGFESLGDLGWADEDGYLYIADRRTDLILVGGRNVFPAEVESALLAHPEVAEAIAIGLPDADMGARVHAIVRLEQGAVPDEAALLAFARERLGTYKLPRSIEFTQEVLRNEMGKARRTALREARLGEEQRGG